MDHRDPPLARLSTFCERPADRPIGRVFRFLRRFLERRVRVLVGFDNSNEAHNENTSIGYRNLLAGRSGYSSDR